MPFQMPFEERWIALVNADPEFLLTSRWSNVGLYFISEGFEARFSISEGRISKSSGSAKEEITLQGSASAWADFLADVPTPPNHHVLGMDRRRDDFTIASGRQSFIRHLRPLARVFELMREAANA